jgi:hypothetical protein
LEQGRHGAEGVPQDGGEVWEYFSFFAEFHEGGFTL